MNLKAGLFAEGAVLREGLLHVDLLERLRESCRVDVQDYTLVPGKPDSPAAPVYPNVPVYKEAIERCIQVLNVDFGFNDIRFLAGAMIPKWRGEGRRGWHVDGWYWENSPHAWTKHPAQIGMLCYLDDATPDTGALIIVPGSHRREVPLHYQTWESWTPNPDERVLPAKAGDCVVLDPRVLHGVTHNVAVDNRICLTLWFLLDYAKLTPSTRATAMLSVGPEFEELCGAAPDFREGDFREYFYNHVKKPQFPICLQRLEAMLPECRDWALIGPAAQPEDDFLMDSATYGWYFAVAAAKAPNKILEIGVKWGYSALAMIAGARDVGVDPQFVGVDGEVDGLACIEVATKNLARVNAKFLLLKADTRNVPETHARINGINTVDIVHVDGDHSEIGIQNELEIAMMWVKPTGLILVDDVDVGWIEHAALQLCESLGIQPILLPTQHGLIVIDMKKRTKYEFQSCGTKTAERTSVY